MKRVFFAVLLSLLVGTGALQAQKPAVRQPKTNPAEKEMTTEKAKLFTGSVVYDVVFDEKEAYERKLKKTEQMRVSSITNNPFEDDPVENRDKESVADGEKRVEAQIIYIKEGAFFSMPPFGMRVEKESYPLYCVMREDGVYVCGEMESVDWHFVDDPQSSFYERVGKKKTIAGHEATLYRCKLPHLKGDIWIAEEYELVSENVPFYGMNHPVLEFDFYIPMEGRQKGKAHLVATEVKTGEVDGLRLGPVMSGELTDGVVLLEYLRRSK